MFYSSLYPSPVGEITLVCDEKGEALVGLWVEGQKYFLSSLQSLPTAMDALPIFCRVKDWLDRYFAGEKPVIAELKLAPMGGTFRQEVWAILRQIPYGQVMTYSEIGKRVAARRGLAGMSSQAVGGAVGHNPLSIIIPCHRVVGSRGSLTGYAAGIEKKIWLLEHEGVDMSGLYVPAKGMAL